jgi:hypothetical protein
MSLFPENDANLRATAVPSSLQRGLRRIAAAVLTLAALGGCAIAGKDVAAGVAGVPPGKGIAVFSTGADELSLSFSTRLMLVDGATHMKYDKVVIFMDPKLGLTYTFPETNSAVRSLTLPAGDYYLVPVPGNPMFYTTAAPIFKFTVAPGVVDYVGGVHVGHARLTVDNSHRQRDMDYFLGKNPALANAPVEESLIVVDRYETRDSADKFEIRGTIWDAPM